MRRTPRPSRLLPVLLALLLAVAGCDAGDGDVGPSAGEPQAAARGGAGAGATVVSGDDGRRLELHRDDEVEILARLDPERDGRIVHAAVRPGDHDELTVLVLTRAQQRYELRYLVADDDGATDLYGFPWRLQAGGELAEAADVAPRPVWAPDGSALAWLERDEEGTRLRTLGWVDDGGSSNPSDEARAYRVPDLPAGARLEAWEVDGHLDVLVADDGEQRWRIELGPTGEAVTAHRVRSPDAARA